MSRSPSFQAQPLFMEDMTSGRNVADVKGNPIVLVADHQSAFALVPKRICSQPLAASLQYPWY
ncbi:unnamed protein product [Chondrus crispus]|uniref:Uncharacterized protein n=1 Tax=Chondrus crispus TaxID=2769 RepID=R7Q7I6_CHOCR|nr:unnamed protein product [Chondrus crispus]CDF33356.1 unnamed protein product [Chondrus crispus]|eukprot:XP_005713159.1 unnamed protein product [Chondrus crispus]